MKILANYSKYSGCKSLKILNILKIADRNYASAESYKITLKSTKVHDFETKPQSEVTVLKEQALLYYTQMFRIRRLESAASALYREKIIRGFLHLYSGQEAIAVGIKASMRPDDGLITAYRCHGLALLQGLTPFHLIAELAGRKSGAHRGKGGSMHLFANRFYGGNGIVGAQVPLGCGVALAIKYKQEKSVIFTMYGDGAANQGQVYEAFNMASLWKLPVIFVCENNEYGMGTSAVRASANPNYYTRGASMLIPGIWVNGMNVLAVREAARFAIEHCISGKGPVIIEASTYRYSGHSMSDPGTSYRSRDEIDEARKTRDPIQKFSDLILSNKIASKEELKSIETNIKHEIDTAVKQTRDSHEAPITELACDIYSNPENITKIRVKTPNHTLPHVRLGPAINA